MAEIKVIIGENGQGKTRYLLDYFNEHIDSEHMAIISNSLINPFPYIPGRKLSYYGLRSSNVRKTNIFSRDINSYFINFIKKDALRGLLKLCKLIGFSDEIIIRQEPLFNIKKNEYNKYNNRYDFIMTTSYYGENIYKKFPFSPIELSHSFVEKYAPYINKACDFHLTYNDSEQENQSFRDHLDYENEVHSQLSLPNIVRLFKTRIFVKKNNITFPIEHASSGELYILSLGLFIQDFLDKENNGLSKVILIDEPENSLHPKRQKDYINYLIGFIEYHDVKIIIATHSPFITMKKNDYIEDISLYSIKNGVISHITNEEQNNNIEQIYYELFGLLTPKNRYLSDYCNKIVRRVAERKMRFSDAYRVINSMKDVAFDEKQENFLYDIIKLLEEVHGGLND